MKKVTIEKCFWAGSMILGATLVLQACGGGGGGSSSASSATLLMGGAVQGLALNLASATVSTIAGSATAPAGVVDGIGNAATFDWPVAVTTDGVNLYVVENCGNTGNNDIRKIVIATGEVSTIAGARSSGYADGIGAAAQFNCPWDITTDGNSLYVADTNSSVIRKITPSSGSLSAITSAVAVVTTLAGSATAASGTLDGTGAAARFVAPSAITTDGKALYVADWKNYTVRKIFPATGSLSAMTSDNAVVITLAGAANTRGSADGMGAAALFNDPEGITTDGKNLYLVDSSNSHTVRKITPTSGSLSAITSAVAEVTTLAGTAGTAGSSEGTGSAALFNNPYYITTDGSNLYVAEGGNLKIRKIAPTSGSLSSITSAVAAVTSITGASGVAGSVGATDGAAATASFGYLFGITTDGKSLFVVDKRNNTIRKIH